MLGLCDTETQLLSYKIRGQGGRPDGLRGPFVVSGPCKALANLGDWGLSAAAPLPQWAPNPSGVASEASGGCEPHFESQ